MRGTLPSSHRKACLEGYRRLFSFDGAKRTRKREVVLFVAVARTNECKRDYQKVSNTKSKNSTLMSNDAAQKTNNLVRRTN